MLKMSDPKIPIPASFHGSSSSLHGPCAPTSGTSLQHSGPGLLLPPQMPSPGCRAATAGSSAEQTAGMGLFPDGPALAAGQGRVPGAVPGFITGFITGFISGFITGFISGFITGFISGGATSQGQ